MNPGDDNNDAIRWASTNGHLQIVERLLEDPRVNPGDSNSEAIQWASEILKSVWRLFEVI